MFQCTGVWALFEATTIMSNRHTKYADHFRRRQSFLARQFWNSDDEVPIVRHAGPPAGPSKTQDSLIEPAGPPAGPSTTRGSIIEHPGQPAQTQLMFRSSSLQVHRPDQTQCLLRSSSLLLVRAGSWCTISPEHRHSRSRKTRLWTRPRPKHPRHLPRQSRQRVRQHQNSVNGRDLSSTRIRKIQPLGRAALSPLVAVQTAWSLTAIEASIKPR